MNVVRSKIGSGIRRLFRRFMVTDWRSVAGATLVSVVCSSPLIGDVVKYKFTVDLTWSPESHPFDFPAGSHLTEHIGAGHDSDFSLWKPGAFATEGIKNLAERGKADPIVSEVEAGVGDGSVYQVIRRHGLSPSPGIRNHAFSMSSTHPLFSIATMLAPSPDWIIGVHDVSFREDGRWIDELTIDLWPYDVGTDSGETYTSPNAPTNPREPISKITSGPFTGTPRLGTYTFQLLYPPGDFDESGDLGSSDIDILCSNLDQPNELIELTGDEIISLDDVTALVEQHLGTRMGDTNLDGDVDFDDFLTLAENFGQDTQDWHRGNFDCDDTVGFPDFLILASSYGFSAREDGDSASTTANSVPEPSGLLMATLTIWLVALIRRRQT